MDLGQGYERIDVIGDCYFEQSLKSQTRNDRGIGSVELFTGESKFPSYLKANFLKNSENKKQLNLFLAEKLCELYKGEQILLVTKERSIQTTNNFLFSESFISDCHPEEADQKLVRHMIHCTRAGYKHILVKTVDIDVILLLLSYRHYAGNLETNVFASFGVGKSACFYDINSIAKKFGEETCRALPFFHTFTGCDNVSSFFNHGKCKFWDRWDEYQEKDVLTDVFIELSTKSVSILANHIETIEKYLIFVYYDSSAKPKDINLLRMIDFEHSTHNNLRLLPPSRVGLIEHIKRAAYEGGWVYYHCMENANLPDPQEWGWKLKSYRFIPKWQIVTDLIDPLDLTVTCSCTKQKCTNCLCRKKNFECIQFCKCQRKCLYAPI